MIEAYFDESGTHRGARILCVACYIGDRERWSFFEDKWEAVLNNFGVSHFHAKDTKCDPLKPYLVKLILNCDLVSVVATINPIDYKRAGEQFKSTLGDAYAVCALACGKGIENWLEKEDRLAIFLEAGQKSVEHVERLFNTLIGHPDYSIASVTRAAKKDYLPLQASDFLAHVMGNHDIKWIEELVTEKNILHAHINAAQINSMSKEIKTLISLRRNMRKAEKKS